VCSKGVCNCEADWAGPQCDTVSQKTYITVNTNQTTVTFSSSNDTNSTATFNIGITIIQEILNGKVVSTFYMNTSIINSSSADYVDAYAQNYIIEATLSNGALLQVNATLFEEETNVTVAGYEMLLNPNMLKYSFSLSNWPFVSLLSQLEVRIQSTAPESGPSQTACDPNSNQNDSSGNLLYFVVNSENTGLYGRVLPVALVDGQARGITYTFDPTTADLLARLPYFWIDIEVDPNYSIFLRGVTPDNIACLTSNPILRNNTLLIEIVVACVVGSIFLVGVAVFIYHVVRRKKWRSRFSKSVRFNSRILDL